MFSISPRGFWILLAVLSAGIALFSLAVTPWFDLEPCHLCIFQRTLFLLMAPLAALAAWRAPSGWGRPGIWLAAPPFLGLATLGSGVAAYQSWLQWQPTTDFSCIAGPPGPIERLVEWLGQQAPTLFLAAGFCEDRELVILGLSLANWAFIAFVAALAVGGWALWRGRHTRHP